MQVLHRDSLPLGGFAGLTEHRLVTDSRLFTGKSALAFEGIADFVYLADARFIPRGETGIHPHKEIDVISIMLAGKVIHQGSLAPGQQLVAGDVQVQRAGGEGFSHNEVNPDHSANRMLQLWVLPEHPGQPAGYKYYQLKPSGATRIYGGEQGQSNTFASHTYIDVVRLNVGQVLRLDHDALVYVSLGSTVFAGGQPSVYLAQEGDLLRVACGEFSAEISCELVVIGQCR